MGTCIYNKKHGVISIDKREVEVVHQENNIQNRNKKLVGIDVSLLVVGFCKIGIRSFANMNI
jgi:hypothetical protein